MRPEAGREDLLYLSRLAWQRQSEGGNGRGEARYTRLRSAMMSAPGRRYRGEGFRYKLHSEKSSASTARGSARSVANGLGSIGS